MNQTANLQLLALNVDDYPLDNEYMIFVRDGEVDPRIVNAFEPICPVIRNRTIQDALAEISNGLCQAVTRGEASNPILLATSSDTEHSTANTGQEDNNDDSADEWPDEDEDEAFGFDEPRKPKPVNIGRNSGSSLAAEDMATIRSDLRQVKDAGFKVGVLGDLLTSGIICVSIRFSKLGISEEVMKAWSVEPQQYFVLLLRCMNGYRKLEKLKDEPNLSGSTEVRLGLCSSYKPNVKSAYDAFNETSVDSTKSSQHQTPASPDDFLPLFIGRPLNELFRSRFTRIVKFREAYCLSWSGAEQLVHDTQGAIIDPDDMDKYDAMFDDTERALPSIVLADVLSEGGRFLRQCSLPLVAMQFALRHFVRCTEFCLVCHCSSGSTFEALKPYVCSNPLCLYQYMGLGFGPSIEWEILSQPYVVDLLISFCYVQTKAGRLRDFPVGIDLRVPVLPKMIFKSPISPIYPSPDPSSTTDLVVQRSFIAPYNGHKQELLFASVPPAQKHSLKPGDWIALVIAVTGTADQDFVYHRIEDVMLPSVKLGPAVRGDSSATDKRAKMHWIVEDKFIDVDCYLFNHNFDELSSDHKSKAILALLDTIPPVKEMQHYLMTHSVGQDSLLRQWRDRISPAALNILRWIIASNRSCIMQVDTVTGEDAAKTPESNEDRVTGMDEYMQFRFAQGAPDKEQRFIDCVEKHGSKTQFPTIFAWHGSPLANWHSIIREGLHFRETMHGRAYGNGVYMSPQAQTSLGYTNMNRGSSGAPWPNSELKITSAMSLNEVVNDPASFVSKSPHLVVSNIDWIQTRYLLVKTSAPHSKNPPKDTPIIQQDPTLAPVGTNNHPVKIPITAVSKSRRPVQEHTNKRKSAGSGRQHEPIELIDDDNESVATQDEDREYLVNFGPHTDQSPIELDSDTDMVMLSDTELEPTESPKKKMRHEEPETALQVIEGLLIDVSKTDFFPGKLDMSNIQILPPPQDASRSASSSLLKAFNALLKTQRTSPAHEVGWYINPGELENMYQWIVELHSFDHDLPLSQDMKAAGLTSVVLEMRFTNAWPFAPPFVRVIKPRFLPFAQRGGGHVLEGGAICMELLTNSGWSAVSSIESVLLQVRLAMSERERPARLASESRHGSGRSGVYGVGEAMAAYERACRSHGWAIPESFAKISQGG